ncbi:minichromosome maintenance protein MCM [Halalkalicoccus subterraneus]|uniref:minichromosome maintenance protein MCM n=1 Tax=Halalkalicoccus subterraneus TaxID=2675002 RepID=UPI000EFB27F2|nr:minichromosome maintenance protein MCM [Halalkalicoccus subterraneus]
MQALGSPLDSGTHTVTKSGIHECLENHASHLLIDTPKYGHWDSYEPLVEQISPSGEISSKVDLVAASFSPEPVSYDIEAFTVDEAAKYLGAVRMITPTVSDVLAEKIAASTHQMNETIEEADVPLQIHPNAVPRLTEANARLTSFEVVEESHLTDVVVLIEECLEQFGITTEEEGEYDVEVIETGRAKTDREHVEWIKTIIRELQEMDNGGRGAPEEKVYERTGQEGIPPKRTKHEIQKLRDMGEIY